MGWAVGEQNIIFYAGNGRIAWRYPKWVQEALVETVAMLCRVQLATNLDDTKAIVCNMGFIWEKIGEEAYKRRETGEGATFRKRKIT